MTIPRSQVRDAAARIAPFVRRTPVAMLCGNDLGLPGDIVLKLEHLQHSGSFKARGAFNTLLTSDVPEAGVIAASGGNHGAAVAYAAAQLGHQARIFVPASAPEAKLARIRRYGADALPIGADYAEAHQASIEEEYRTGALRVHAYDQPSVIAGQGTVAVEFGEQAPQLDAVLIAVGGGGLIAGCASWYTDSLRLVAVEPERAPTMHAALAAGKPVDVAVGGLAADALGARRLGDITFSVASRYVKHSLLVTDQAIRQAQRVLWEELRVLAEPGGATALAALLCGAYVATPGEHIGVVVCGANLDPTSWSVLPEAEI